ncbi:hypothetical protein M0811_12120 [Anaeramoeba ignava]|uniref:Thioredoxin domain-containing protein n=1 Tax=Anaeramoeba ignava TaxID=1746090 RepID=A0A9Q0LCA6_ANAIG|nr:hypothetical protein M0811_12120 [Anaeramoeba ignava]
MLSAINQNLKSKTQKQTINSILRFIASKFQISIEGAKEFKEKVTDSDKPVIVDFYADWCGPCRMIAKPLDKFVDSHEGKVILAKVNVDRNDELAFQYEVSGIPTVYGFYKGKVVDRFVGLPEEDFLKKFVEKMVKTGEK